LRLIDDQHGSPIFCILSNQVIHKNLVQLGPGFAGVFQAERLQYPAQQLAKRMMGVGDKTDRDIVADLIQQARNNVVLPVPALPLMTQKQPGFPAVLKQRHGHLMLLAQIEIGRVWQQGKWLFPQPVKGLVHGWYSLPLVMMLVSRGITPAIGNRSCRICVR